MRRVLAGLLLLGLLGLVAGCTDAARVVQDQATCPGESCTDDARRIRDAVAAVERVTDVHAVSRSERLDRGAVRSAEVSAEVEGHEEALGVASAVLRVLEDWPEAGAGDALVTVTADPPVPVRQVERGEQSLSPAFYDPCDPAACRAAVADLEAVVADLPGVTEVSAAVAGPLLRLSVAAAEPPGQVVTAVLDAAETDLGLRVADRVRVLVEHTGPLIVTVRQSGEKVCEQPPGLIVACDAGNSLDFD